MMLAEIPLHFEKEHISSTLKPRHSHDFRHISQKTGEGSNVGDIQQIAIMLYMAEHGEDWVVRWGGVGVGSGGSCTFVPSSEIMTPTELSPECGLV